MSIQEYATYQEITSQTEAWVEAIGRAEEAVLPEADSYSEVIFTGCGSTYYLSLAAARLYQELTGQAARAAPGGELYINPQTVLADAKTLLVATSRSGTTTETVKAVEQFKKDKRGEVIVISNYDRDLSKLGDVSIVIPKGQEESIAQTRSFTSMYLAATVFSTRMAGRDDLLASLASLSEIGTRMIRDYESDARQLGENLFFDRFYFLGSGIRYGLACEVNLKMKEMTLTHSEPFHFLEFRHGPMSMVNEKAAIVGLVSESSSGHEKAVLDEMQALGGKIFALAETGETIAFESGIPESMRGVLYLPILQLMAFYRSLAKGLNPDRPKNLEAVVTLEA